METEFRTQARGDDKTYSPSQPGRDAAAGVNAEGTEAQRLRALKRVLCTIQRRMSPDSLELRTVG